MICTCEVCGKEFNGAASDEEVADEYYDNFGTYNMHDSGVVCNDCYEEFMRWLKAQQQ